MTWLPSPAERPEGDIVIYDGECNFCRSQVERLARWDSRAGLSFLSLHDPEVWKRFTELTHERLMREMVVVDKQGRAHGGAAALRYLSLRLPRLRILAPLMHVPFSLPLWQVLYRQVAKRRYRLAGKRNCDSDACSLHFD
jgi:predicted DCC family thiol-disulfide oxidoreductase YuxK